MYPFETLETNTVWTCHFHPFAFIFFPNACICFHFLKIWTERVSLFGKNWTISDSADRAETNLQVRWIMDYLAIRMINYTNNQVLYMVDRFCFIIWYKQWNWWSIKKVKWYNDGPFAQSSTNEGAGVRWLVVPESWVLIQKQPGNRTNRSKNTLSKSEINWVVTHALHLLHIQSLLFIFVVQD